MIKLYRAIAGKIGAMQNCQKSGNPEWFHKHRDKLRELVAYHMPSGSGLDAGVELDMDESKPNRLVFATSFHHMNDNGYYDGWTTHNIIVTPDLYSGFDLRVTGRDKRGIKEYLGELFHGALSLEIEES